MQIVQLVGCQRPERAINIEWAKRACERHPLQNKMMKKLADSNHETFSFF